MKDSDNQSDPGPGHRPCPDNLENICNVCRKVQGMFNVMARMLQTKPATLPKKTTVVIIKSLYHRCYEAVKKITQETADSLQI